MTNNWLAGMPSSTKDCNGCSGRSGFDASKWQQMAVDGSFWEGLPAVWARAARSTTNSLDGLRSQIHSQQPGGRPWCYVTRNYASASPPQARLC